MRIMLVSYKCLGAGEEHEVLVVFCRLEACRAIHLALNWIERGSLRLHHLWYDIHRKKLSLRSRG